MYFGSYFLLVRPGFAHAEGGSWFRIVEYRFEPEPGLIDPRAFYKLANGLDQRFLRPTLWAGTYDPLALMCPGFGIKATQTHSTNGSSQ
jgi:hypothetical protein